jgi:hypothetical protein
MQDPKNDDASCVSKAIFIGDEKLIRVKPETLEKFKYSPVAGCTSVMAIAQRGAAYYPALVTPGNDKGDTYQANASTFNEYIRKLSDSPLFSLSMTDSKNLTHTSKDFNVLVDQIAGLFQGIATADIGTIRQGLVSLARAAVSRTRTQQKQFLFTQNVLHCVGEAVEVNIYSSFVTMSADSGKGGTTTQAEYRVEHRKLNFRVDLWPEVAELVWRQQASSIEEWVKANTTMPDPRFTARLCIEQQEESGRTPGQPRDG